MAKTVKQWCVTAVLIASMPLVHAAEADPVFGTDAQANALLACHADYAKRHATAPTAQRMTATEVAVAAQARCAGQFQAFVASRLDAAQGDAALRAMLQSKAVADEEANRLREYAHAYTLDAYLSAISGL